MKFRQFRAVLVKDLRLFFVSEGVIYVSMVLSIGLVAVFRFGHGIADMGLETANSILWAAQLISGIFLMMASYEWEHANKSHYLCRILGVEAYIQFLGKASALAVALVILWLCNLLFFFVLLSGFFLAPDTGVQRFIKLFFDLLLAGTFVIPGLALMGTLTSSIAGQGRLKHALLFILFFPLALPVLISGSTATRVLLQFNGLELQVLYIALAFDLVYLGAGILLYALLIEE